MVVPSAGGLISTSTIDRLRLRRPLSHRQKETGREQYRECQEGDERDEKHLVVDPLPEPAYRQIVVCLYYAVAAIGEVDVRVVHVEELNHGEDSKDGPDGPGIQSGPRSHQQQDGREQVALVHPRHEEEERQDG